MTARSYTRLSDTVRKAVVDVNHDEYDRHRGVFNVDVTLQTDEARKLVSWFAENGMDAMVDHTTSKGPGISVVSLIPPTHEPETLLKEPNSYSLIRSIVDYLRHPEQTPDRKPDLAVNYDKLHTFLQQNPEILEQGIEADNKNFYYVLQNTTGHTMNVPSKVKNGFIEGTHSVAPGEYFVIKSQGEMVVPRSADGKRNDLSSAYNAEAISPADIEATIATTPGAGNKKPSDENLEQAELLLIQANPELFGVTEDHPYHALLTDPFKQKYQPDTIQEALRDIRTWDTAQDIFDTMHNGATFHQSTNHSIFLGLIPDDLGRVEMFHEWDRAGEGGKHVLQVMIDADGNVIEFYCNNFFEGNGSVPDFSDKDGDSIQDIIEGKIEGKCIRDIDAEALQQCEIVFRGDDMNPDRPDVNDIQSATQVAKITSPPPPPM